MTSNPNNNKSFIRPSSIKIPDYEKYHSMQNETKSVGRNSINLNRIKERADSRETTLDDSDPYAVNIIEQSFQAQEAFKMARTNIDFSIIKEGCKTITITSCFAQEGKTTFSTNLSRYFAQIEGNRVLLIDCDMRKPKVHRAMGVPSVPGLSNYLAHDLDIEEVLHWVPEYGLFVMSAGIIVPSAAELIASDRFRKMLKILEGSFDYIILDTPPVLVVTDALSAIPNTDGAVVVANYKKTLIPQLDDTLQAIKNIKGKILGVILNQVPAEGKSYGGRYSYYYDDYSDEE